MKINDVELRRFIFEIEDTQYHRNHPMSFCLEGGKHKLIKGNEYNLLYLFGIDTIFNWGRYAKSESGSILTVNDSDHIVEMDDSDIYLLSEKILNQLNRCWVCNGYDIETVKKCIYVYASIHLSYNDLDF